MVSTSNRADPVGAATNIRPSFSAPGFYSFQCVNHGAEGMAGVVWVTPE
jgi:plastocyanin